MKLFTRNSPYYHLLKYLLFLLKHPVYVQGMYSVILSQSKSTSNVNIIFYRQCGRVWLEIWQAALGKADVRNSYQLAAFMNCLQTDL